jgi:hypothetical protein
MKRSKEIKSIVEQAKIECYYFTREDLKALFELYYKNNIHIGYKYEYEYDGVHVFNIPNNNNYPSKPDAYDQWSDRLTDMFYAKAIPAGKYLIESDYYCQSLT